ncbi:MAG: SpoIIE family protein phosphatase [Geobacter sp.]|nr:SpoIIE family protein phosphatase [Geobacter sp.]
MLSAELVIGVSLAYILFLFAIAYYADWKQEKGESIISNPHVYSLSIAVYATTWTFYGSVGKAATTGLDFLLVYLGPTLTAFSWWFLLRKIVRIAKENNITSIADFISSRYGKSEWLGALVTIIIMIGITPYLAVQLKAVSTTFDIICGYPRMQLPFMHYTSPLPMETSFYLALILSVFGVIFGARHLVATERHAGLVAAIAVESIVKLFTFLSVGVFVTYFLFNGFTDIFSRLDRNTLFSLTSFGQSGQIGYPTWFATLYLSMGAIILLPRQFHILVIENTDEEHIKEAMWRFPVYMFLINLFVVPIAMGGIILTGGNAGADYFVLTVPMKSGHPWLSLLAFLGGFSAAAGMVMVESVAVSTMFLNHLVMPVVVRLKARAWFPKLLINMKRLGIFLVVFLGYIYQHIIGETYILVHIGLISFAAVAQFGPALIGGLYWRRGNRAGAMTGITLGFLAWFYTLLLPSLVKAGWWQTDIIERGPFGITFLKPTALFGLTGFDIWSHSLFWSLFLNIGVYLICSIMLHQDEKEREQVRKFVDVFEAPKEEVPWETKRLTKPVTVMQFVNLMSKFIGEKLAHEAISNYMGNRNIDESGGVSEFELPKLKRFVEKTIAGSVGAAAAGAIVESYLSDLGSRMESVYDVFGTVRASLEESRESLSMRLTASQIMSRTLDLQIIMDDLLELLRKEFGFDLTLIRLINEEGKLTIMSYKGVSIKPLTENERIPEIDTYLGDAYLSNEVRFINDTQHMTKPRSKELLEHEGIKSFAHIPVARVGEPPAGVLSVYSRSIIGLFTEPLIKLLESLAGQLAQAVAIATEMEAKERERKDKEKALLERAKVVKEMEIAKEIQMSLLPLAPPEIRGVQLEGRCISAAHVGGDYFDYIPRDENSVDIVIADVSGHSIGAALIMSEARTVLRAEAIMTTGAMEIVKSLNQRLYDDLSRAELFITMFYAKYNADTRLLTYANAGHNRPLLIRKGEESCQELDAEGLILGVKYDPEYEEKSVILWKGDTVLFYTDGITEAESEAEEQFGTERLCKTICTNRELFPGEIMDAVLAEVSRFSNGKPLRDDVSMVVLKIV